jgi:hypothetical protein
VPVFIIALIVAWLCWTLLEDRQWRLAAIQLFKLGFKPLAKPLLKGSNYVREMGDNAPVPRK